MLRSQIKKIQQFLSEKLSVAEQSIHPSSIQSTRYKNIKQKDPMKSIHLIMWKVNDPSTILKNQMAPSINT